MSGAIGLTLKTAAVMVIGYLAYLEVLQLRSLAYEAWAKSCIARQQNEINFSTLDELASGHLSGHRNALDKECRTL